MSPRSTVPLFALALLAVPATARAGDSVAAQALFDQGKQLVEQGRYAEACPKLAESEKLDPGMGTEFHLADCWQRIGRTASAWALFRQVESEASASGQAGRTRVARDRASAIEPMLAKIEIDAGAAANTPGLAITRDGAAVSRELWGVSVPVDPGPHVIAVQAPNKLPWQTRIDVAPRGNVAHVEIPLLADDVPPTPPPAAYAPQAAPPYPLYPPPPRPGVTQPMPNAPVQETPVVENRGGAVRGLGWFFVGTGVAGLGVSAYFTTKYVQDQNANNTADAATQRKYAFISGGAGLTSIVLGTILAATAPSPRVVMTTAAGVDVTPMVGPNVGGLSMHGAF